jgi:RND superfamily putative drug exporter
MLGDRSERRRAALTLVGVGIVVAALGLVGTGVEDHLEPTSLKIAGTSSARGEELARERFGESSPFAVLLRGPAAAVERQGRGLAKVLRRENQDLTVISPWDRVPAARQLPAPPAGAAPGTRARALLLLDYRVPLAAAMRETVPELEDTLAANVQAPVKATQSGFATISRALQHESLDAAERAELLAAPLLLIVLLLVFRSALAALIPLVFGAVTVLAGRGVLIFLTSLMPIDALSLVVCTMMGLALGVDYSLLIVSRFREELAAGRPPAEAARITRSSAGRTTAIAGATLFFSIFLSAFLQPGTLLVSLAATLAVVTSIAVLIAWAALPALLLLLGPRINAGRIGRVGAGTGSRVAAAATSALRRPALAAALIVVPLLALSAPALAFDTGSPGVEELSSSSSARQNSETISAAVGAGWQAPFILTLAAESGPITSPRRLPLLSSTQRRIAGTEGVKAVIGPAAIVDASRPLRDLASDLRPGEGGPAERLARLGPRLRQASGAVAGIRGGLEEASAAGGLLGEGSARAGEGAGLLANGLERAGAGGDQATAALDRLALGSERLAKGQRIATGAAYSLSLGLGTLLPNLTAQGLGRARSLSTRLRSAAAEDPTFAPAAHEAEVLASVLAANREELSRLRAQALSLRTGLGRLESGGKRLSEGSGTVATRAQSLSSGLDALGGGAEALAGGLGELRGGAEALSSGLAEGSARAYPLQRGLGKAGERVSRIADPLARRLRDLGRLSPRLLDSGYLAVAALDGADTVRRSLAAEVIDVSNGGTAARYVVVPEAGLNSAGSRRLDDELGAIAARLERRPGYTAAVSGGGAVLNDYGETTKSRLPLVVGSIVLITFLMLVALLRAPLLAAVTVGLNLLSVAAAIGVVTIACQIPAGYPLGGHSYIDTVGAGAIFGVTFGLSIDYAVFLLARMRESYRGDGDNAAAIRFGLEKSAGVITGAAAIMAAVFASFATASVATVSQMGLGLTVAILLDATVVRIVLLPALMLLIGERVWRTPGWLERILPAPRARPIPATEAAS